jgi:sugar phosphate isomerase/epimerase
VPSPSGLGPDDLVLTASSIGCPPFEELVTATADAGFAGLSLWPAPTWGRARAEGWSDAAMRSRLADAGLVVHDVDAIIAWAGPDDPGGPYFEEAPRDVLLGAAEALGARIANVLLMGPRSATEDDAAETLAGVCDVLAARGLVATLEFGRGTPVPDLATARRVVGAVGRGSSVMLDAWQLRFGPTTPADVAATPGPLLGGVQLDDAPAEKPADVGWANRHERLVPGEGAVDLVGLVRALRTAGSTAPLAVEVFHDALLAELGPARMAHRLGDAVRAVVAAADGT